MSEAPLDLAALSVPTLVGTHQAPGSRAPDARPTVLVPTGSTEQHGPHLPFGTDTVIASEVAAGVAARLNSDRGGIPSSGDDEKDAAAPDAAAHSYLVAPALPYGASGEHQQFAGTVSIGHDALTVVLVELVRSLSTWAQRVVFVNAHGGNVASLRAAVTAMIGEQHAVSWVSCAAALEHSPVDPASDSHAGHTETSLLLHLAPHTVDMSRAAPGNTAPLGRLMPTMRAGGVTAVSPNGVLGDPTGATAVEGARLFDAIVASVTALIAGGTTDDAGRLV